MLLLHVCCAPCSLPFIEKTKDLTLYFFNPNIYPEKEYSKRLKEVKKIASIYNLELFEGEYNHGKWLDFVRQNLTKPPGNYPENDERCLECFKFRLAETASFAKEHHFDEFATSLSLSLFKDAGFINNFAEILAKKYSLKYRELSLKPQDAFRKGLELSKKYHLYRQKYCGCEFSQN